jgi:hypothetical protein
MSLEKVRASLITCLLTNNFCKDYPIERPQYLERPQCHYLKITHYPFEAKVFFKNMHDLTHSIWRCFGNEARILGSVDIFQKRIIF